MLLIKNFFFQFCDGTNVVQIYQYWTSCVGMWRDIEKPNYVFKLWLT
jgi:hypothetical protein